MAEGRSGTLLEPYEYQEWVKPARTQIVPTSRGRFEADLSFVPLHEMTAQGGSQSLPIAVRSELHPSRYALMFQTGDRGPPFAVDGIGVDRDMFVLAAPNTEHFLQIPATSRWATVTMPSHAYLVAHATLTGRDAGSPATTSIVRARPGAIARLHAIHERIMAMVQGDPGHFSHPEVARSADQALLAAAMDCFAQQADIVGPSFDGRRRTILLRKFHQLLEASDGLPLYISEVCIQLGVTTRNLHRACVEHTGLSPQQYLWMRRMHLARRALIAADPRLHTVTGIAADFGFWEHGRFSVRYKWLFGESPSATLGRLLH